MVLREDGKLKLKLFEWGMLAEYMKGTTIDGADRKKQLDLQRMKLLNARAERIIQDHKSVWFEVLLQSLYPQADTGLIKDYLNGFVSVADGSNKKSRIAALDIASRFRWLTSVRSTFLQTSRIHTGLNKLT